MVSSDPSRPLTGVFARCRTSLTQGKERTIVTTFNSTKNNQQQVAYKCITGQMVAWRQRLDSLQIYIKSKSTKSQYFQGSDANKVSGSLMTMVPYHAGLPRILKEDQGIPLLRHALHTCQPSVVQ